MCHGEQMEGNPPVFPTLVGISKRLTQAQVTTIVTTGRGKMPPVSGLKGDELTAVLAFLGFSGQPPAAPVPSVTASAAPTTTVADVGAKIFQQNCTFCHGRDAMGGESGPDLTRSKLVFTDLGGDNISEVVRNGRNGERKMPAFNLSADEMTGLVTFLHRIAAEAARKKGGRRGVEVSDLQTGDVEAGRRYFNGPGTCATCHSPTGDLAGVASRYQGLELEERMLYPRRVQSKVTVTLPSGEKIMGTLAYKDEFVLGMHDSAGTYRSWKVGNIKYSVDSPVTAHADLLPKYSDADVHNLMAYIQTLR
jgi:mono/diheme cytochrome c family protein